MYHGYLALGGVEIGNAERCLGYGLSGIAPTTFEPVGMDVWPRTHVWLGQNPYTRPELDGAPWYDPWDYASREFGGMWPTMVEGLETTEVDQPVSEAAGDGGAAGVVRLPTRTIKVQAVLLAATSRGLAYGLRWLTRTLLDNPGAASRDLEFLDHMPGWEPTDLEPDTRAKGDRAARLVSNVVCTQAPEIDERFGGSHLPGDHAGTGCTVEFELTAMSPRIWRSPVSLFGPTTLNNGDPMGTRFQPVGDDGRCPTQCWDDDGVLVDPALGELWTLPRPAAPSAGLGCELMDTRRTVLVVPQGLIPTTGEMLPTVTVQAGDRDERRVRVRWVRGLITDDSDEAIGCSTIGEVMVTYLPRGATLSLDGRSGKAWATRQDGQVQDATSVTVGRAGAPWRAPRLRAGAPYTVLIDTDQDVPSDVFVSAVGVTGEV